MNKALKIVLAAYGAGLTVVGLSYFFFGQEDVRRVSSGQACSRWEPSS